MHKKRLLYTPVWKERECLCRYSEQGRRKDEERACEEVRNTLLQDMEEGTAEIFHTLS